MIGAIRNDVAFLIKPPARRRYELPEGEPEQLDFIPGRSKWQGISAKPQCRSPRVSKGVIVKFSVTPLLTRGLLHLELRVARCPLAPGNAGGVGGFFDFAGDGFA